MAYTPTTWANSPSTATPLSAANLNKMETGIDQAHDHLDNAAIHVPTAGAGGTTNFLRADGTWAAPPGGAGISDGDKGDITVSASGTVWTVDNNSISNAKLAQIATARLRGRVTAATGNVEDLTGTQATTLLDIFTTSLKGLAPASGGGTTNFLRADGTWAAPPGGAGISDGDKGDITVSGSGAVWTIDNGAVTLAKQANVNTARIMGRVTAAAGVQEELTGAQATTLLDTFTTSLKGLAPASGGGTTNFLRADGTWANPPGGAGISDGDKGDITVSGSGTVWTIDNNSVSNAKLAQIATARLRGRVTAATGNVEDLTGTQATTLLDIFTTSLKGLAPASGGGTTNFLRADGTWAAPPGGGGVSDGDKGDITVSGSGAVWTIDNGAITLAKQANVNSARIMGRVTASAGVQEELTGAQATTLLDTFTTSLKGLAPASGGGTTNFLRADGTWAAPSGGGGGSAGVVRDTITAPSNATGVDGDWNILRVGSFSAVLQERISGAYTKDFADAGSKLQNLSLNSRPSGMTESPAPGWQLYINDAMTAQANIDKTANVAYTSTGFHSTAAGSKAAVCIDEYAAVGGGSSGALTFLSATALVGALPESGRFFTFGNIGQSAADAYGFGIRVDSAGNYVLFMADAYVGDVTLVGGGTGITAGQRVFFERFGQTLRCGRIPSGGHTLTGILEGAIPTAGGYAVVFGKAGIGFHTDSNTVRVREMRFVG